ncbi:MAG: DUF1573 domain-containing protein [Salibacteraceae bacterium]
MKNKMIGLVLLSALTLAACGGDDSKAEAEVTTENVEATTSISFEEEVFDFGTITQGEKVTHVFKFRNTGDADLVIVSAKGSCGCTVPEWPKEPIKPGAEGEINVVFNSEGKSGKQHKRVSVVANTEPATTPVALKGEIIAPETDAASEEENPTEE